MNRQSNVQQQQQNVVAAHPTNTAGTQPLLTANNLMLQRVQFVNYNSNGQQFYSGYSQPVPYGYFPMQAHPQSTDTSGYGIPINSIPSNSHLPNHRQPPHQMTQPMAMPPPNMNSYSMLQQLPRPKDQLVANREKKILEFTDPKTGEAVTFSSIDRNSGSNTHSSAIKIEAPPPAHNQIQSESQSTQPPNSRTMPSAQSTSDGSAILLATSNETEQTTCKFSVSTYSYHAHHMSW